MDFCNQKNNLKKEKKRKKMRKRKEKDETKEEYFPSHGRYSARLASRMGFSG